MTFPSARRKMSALLAVIFLSGLLFPVHAGAATPEDEDLWFGYPAGREIATPKAQESRWTQRILGHKPVRNAYGASVSLGTASWYLAEPVLDGSNVRFTFQRFRPARSHDDNWHTSSGGDPEWDIRNFVIRAELQFTCDGSSWRTMGSQAGGYSTLWKDASDWVSFSTTTGSLSSQPGCNGDWANIIRFRFGSRIVEESGPLSIPGLPFASSATEDISLLSYWTPGAPFKSSGGAGTTGQCFSWFGTGYRPWDTVDIGGVTYTAEEMGCLQQPEEDYYTSFEYMCRDAPEFSWIDPSTVGPWLGHYARCLTIPNSVNWEPIEDAFNASFLGESIAYISGFPQFPSRSCGELSLPGQYGFNFDTCEAANMMTNASPAFSIVRTALAWVVYFGIGMFIIHKFLQMTGYKLAVTSPVGRGEGE